MLTEITLTIDETTLAQAKDYAYEKNTDLSTIMVNYLRTLPKKAAEPFDYDLSRMKDRVENQDFVEMPDSVKTGKDLQRWLAKITD